MRMRRRESAYDAVTERMEPPSARADASARRKQLDLARLRHRLRQHRDLVRRRGPAGQCDLAHSAATGSGRRGRGFGRLREAGLAEVGGVREPGRVAAHDPDARAAQATGGELLDAPVVESAAAAQAILGEHLGEVAAAAERGLEGALEHGRLDQLCCHRHRFRLDTAGTGGMPMVRRCL